MTHYKVKDQVTWVSSCMKKTGTVMAVLSPGDLPVNHGFGIIGAVSRRDHTSYVILGRVRGRKETLYWPIASLLTPADTLSDAEVAWCHHHAEAVRSLMIRGQ